MSKKVGGVKQRAQTADQKCYSLAKLFASRFLVGNQGKVIHRLDNKKLPGDFRARLEEAAHHVAMSVCEASGHPFSPCTTCLAWADLEVFALAMGKVELNGEAKPSYRVETGERSDTRPRTTDKLPRKKTTGTKPSTRVASKKSKSHAGGTRKGSKRKGATKRK